MRASAARRSAPAAAERPAGVEDWRNARTRGEKSGLIREALFRAAAEVVGEVGYADASIALITRTAGVAQGTFYNHFESRQDILDQLLPALGAKMRAHVREQARGGEGFVEREERSFRAFFSFLRRTPHFFRILNEAESFAPRAHREHLDTVARTYLSFLKREHRAGAFSGYAESELETVVFILMAARSYLAWRYVYGEERADDVPESVVRTYMKFVTHGLVAASGAQPAPRRTRARRAAPDSRG